MMQNLRKRHARLWALALAFLMLITFTGAAAAETYALVTGTQSLNLRAEANSSSQWLGTYSRGAWVEVTGSENNFYRVRTADNKTGYMSKNFLASTDGVTYGNTAIVSNAKATAFLNLRSYPSYSAAVVTILYNGVPLTVLSSENGWYQVQMGSLTGYVRSEFTTVSYQPIGVKVGTIKTPNNTAVNMRVGPGTDKAVRRQFAGDRYVSVIYQGSGWWYVCIDGFLGFISSDFLAEGLQAERDLGGQGSSGAGYAVVNNPASSQRLNLREQPNTAATIIAQLSNGDKLTVLVQGTEWSKVYTQTLAASGYVMTKYLTLHNLPSTPTLKTVHPQGSFVNMRSAATMTASVLTRIPSGKSATIIMPGADWTKVRYNGMTGYIMNCFTSIAGK